MQGTQMHTSEHKVLQSGTERGITVQQWLAFHVSGAYRWNSVMLYMLDGLLTWTAHSEHLEVRVGPSWSSFALKVRSLLLPGFQDPYKSVLLHKTCSSTGLHLGQIYG
jgi:hypothetical protein